MKTMKELKRRTLTFFLIASLPLASCDILDPLPEYEVEPQPLEVKGDSVRVKIDVNFQPKSFHKKAIITAKPILEHQNEDGQTDFEDVTFQGEKVTENHESIPNEDGKSYTYEDKVAYSEEMMRSILKVELKGGKEGKDPEELTSDSIGVGVITTPYLMMNDDKPLLGKDKFKRVTEHQERAVIHYLVNSSRVRPSELRDDDIEELEAFLDSTSESEDLELKGLDLISYASPEGELSRNEDLAEERASSAQDYFEKALGKADIDDKEDGFYDPQPQGEDWEGFKKAMQKSDIEDKELILRVLEQYGDTKKREKEIRNMAETYNVIKKKILPDLRRSQMLLQYEVIGKTDEELKKLARSNPDTLRKEELMKAAALYEDPDDKLRVYKEVEKRFPDDWRGPNNVGYVQMMKNKPEEARKKFQKAADIEETAVVKNNLGISARLKGDRKKAADLFKAAKSAGNEAGYNLALVNIQDGDYEAANSNIGDFDTFNKALLQVLTGELDAAINTLDKAPEAKSAKGLYLKAIIGARKEDKEMLIDNLKSAVEKDSSLKERAKNDAEFHKYWGDSEFQGVIG